MELKRQEGPVMSLSPVSEAGAGPRDITGHRAHAPPLPQCLVDPRLPSPLHSCFAKSRAV